MSDYLTNCVTYYGAKIIHQDSLEDLKNVLDIKWRIMSTTLYSIHAVKYTDNITITRLGYDKVKPKVWFMY